MAGLLGTGGVNRGRGDAAMIWGEETPGSTERFEPDVLPPARYLDEESSGVIGVGTTSPEAAPVAEGAGLAEIAPAGGGAAWQRRLAPRHRRAVRSFFAPSGGRSDDGDGG